MLSRIYQRSTYFFYKIVLLIKKINLARSTVGNIIRKYKKYGDGTANLPRNGRPRKINERTSRWISRNVQINPFITSSEIKTDFEGAGINVNKDIISRALYRTGFHSRSPRKGPLLKTKYIKDRLKFVETYEKRNIQFWEKKNLVEWNESWTLRKEHSDKCLVKKWQEASRSTIPSPQLSLGVVSLWYGDAFNPRALVSYKLSMVEWMVTCTGRF